MSVEIEHLLTAGGTALQAGDWTAARNGFRAALELEETPEALWWIGEDLDECISCRERAYTAFRRRPDPAQAAFTALALCVDFHKQVGNAAAAAGWLSRAARLIEEHQLEFLHGWLALTRAFSSLDPVVGEQSGREALGIARATGDADLELGALSQIGALLVKQGRIEEGVACLDESMAGSLGGEGVNLGTVVMASCNMIISCSECAEFERAVQWVRAADRFTRRYGCPFLYVECRVFYGGVLVATGAWGQAEEELRLALSASRSSMPALHRKALATLAELRFAQGRLEEAERLVAGLENHHEAATVQAAIHLARGKPTLATAVIRRRLDVIGEGQLESAQLVELLGEADIVEGRHQRAEVRGRELAAAAAAVGCAVAAARGERLWGHALAVGSDGAGAPQHLEAALSRFIRLEMPFEAARTRLLLAETLREVEPDVAAAEASGALAAFEDLGAGADADIAAALLRQLGVKAARSGPKRTGTLTKREREVLGLLGEGLSNPEIAGRLHLSRKTVEHHVASVLAKLGARSRAEAAAAAVRQDWVESAAR